MWAPRDIANACTALAVLVSIFHPARSRAQLAARTPPTFDDFWKSDACWRTDVETVGGSFTGRQFIIDAPDGSNEVWDYTTVANKTAAGVSYNCVVLFRSTDRGRSFVQYRSAPGSELPCLVPDRSDIVQQQYPAVAPLPPDSPEYKDGQRLVMVYETGGANFYRTSADGLSWSNKTHVAMSGACQGDASGLPFERKHCGGCASDNRTILRGAPPGIFLDQPSGELYHLLNTGACPGSLSCLRGKSMSSLRLCASNPLFVGGTTRNKSQAFDYHFTSGAQLLHTTESHYYLTYQGEGEVQWWRAGLARVNVERGVDSVHWQKYNASGEWFDPGHNGGNRTHHTQEGSLLSVWKDRLTNMTYRYYRRSRKVGSGRDVLDWCDAGTPSTTSTTDSRNGLPAVVTTPSWDWEPEHQWESCITVKDSSNGGNYTWKNDSRLVWTALPPGPAPAGGWPVLIDFSVIDFPSVSNQTCGLAGEIPPDLPSDEGMGGNHPKVPPVPCSNHTNNVTCYGVYGQQNGKFEFASPCRWNASISVCQSCNVTADCWPPPCSASRYQNRTRCPDRLKNGQLNPHSRCVWNTSHSACVSNPHPVQKHRGFTENFRPFQSALSMGMQCSCFAANGVFNCTVPQDNGRHPSPKRSVGCNLDDFAGGIWFQRIKQYLLSNGIAVMVINPYVFDGWNAYEEVWKHGADHAFLERLTEEMATSDGVFRAKINPSRVGFHGWSGSAQMVSWAINLAASGNLSGLTVKAGVMMAGGSHACYNEPPVAKGVCAKCNASDQCSRGPNTDWPFPPTGGCSSKMAARGQTPCCMFCCPDNYTEDWYYKHPEDYTTHPATFLGQTEVDSGADSCAASHYHETMLSHGARSELHIVPLNRMRCFSVGDLADPDPVASSSPFAQYCDSRPIINRSGYVTSTNHTVGFGSMVLPLTQFLSKYL